jgi:hypothetical protein
MRIEDLFQSGTDEFVGAGLPVRSNGDAKLSV